MDYVQKHNICNNVPSPQTFRSYQYSLGFSFNDDVNININAYREESEVLGKTCPSDTSPTINPIRFDVGLNPGPELGNGPKHTLSITTVSVTTIPSQLLLSILILI
jgi:hypothetical protein